MRLWEALWGSQDKPLHLVYALAILRQHKHKMIQQEMEFDKVLKFEWPCPSYRLLAYAQRCRQHVADGTAPGHVLTPL
jgi:hypothetical protein